MIGRRRLVAALAAAALAAAALLPMEAGAAGGAGKGKEIFAPLPAITVEYWDEAGLFHLVDLSLTVVYAKEGVKVGKDVGSRIQQRLSAMPWEHFVQGNPAVTIKKIALDIARADAQAGEHVVDILIAKLMMR